MRKKTEFHLDLSYLVYFFLQQKVIYYLCILLKDPVEPHGISQVVPLFQVSTEDFSWVFSPEKSFTLLLL